MQNTKAAPDNGKAAKRDSAPPSPAKAKASHPRKDGLAKYARDVGKRLK